MLTELLRPRASNGSGPRRKLRLQNLHHWSTTRGIARDSQRRTGRHNNPRPGRHYIKGVLPSSLRDNLLTDRICRSVDSQQRRRRAKPKALVSIARPRHPTTSKRSERNSGLSPRRTFCSFSRLTLWDLTTQSWRSCRCLTLRTSDSHRRLPAQSHPQGLKSSSIRRLLDGFMWCIQVSHIH